MKKEEFLSQLEYLLQDIPEEDKREAIDYYRDYLEEAGASNEEGVLEGFGSPEKIAAIIRTDLLGGMEAGGEFTDKGYEDLRFETASYPALRKREASGHERQGQESYADRSKRIRSDKGIKPVTEQGWFRVFMIIIFILIGLPILLSAAAAVFSGVMGVGSVLLVLLIVLAILTVVGFVAGVALLFWGFTGLWMSGWFGVMCIGAGLVFLGAGCVLLVCSILFYGTFLPWLIHGLISLWQRLFGRKKDKSSDENKSTDKNKSCGNDVRYRDNGKNEE